MNKSPQGELPAGKAIAEELRPCATELDDFDRHNKKIQNIILAVSAAIFTVLGSSLGAYGISAQRKFDRVMAKIADDVAATRTMVGTKAGPNCDAIMSVVKQSDYSGALLRQMCDGDQVHAYVQKCLREAGICLGHAEK